MLAWPGHETAADRYPRTAWRATARRFVTRARTSDQQDGMLALAGTVDIDLTREPLGGKPPDTAAGPVVAEARFTTI